MGRNVEHFIVFTAVFVNYLNFMDLASFLVFFTTYNFLAMHFSTFYILLIISIVYNYHFLCIRSICCVCLCN